MADPQVVLSTLRKASMLSRATPGRRGSFVHLNEAVADLAVVGDLHGHLDALRAVLREIRLDDHPNRHLVLQELVHGRWTYPDGGGDRSHQLVDVVAALKCRYPERIHIILGNHELAELTGRAIGKDGVSLNGQFDRGIRTAYGDSADQIMDAYHEFFRSMPIGVRTTNRVLLCHTLPNASDLERLDLGLLERGIWTEESMKRGGTIYAMTWGRDTRPETADQFAAWIDADWFITGHQPCHAGFHRANHRLLIVDGTLPNPSYCLFPARGPIDLDGLVDGVRSVPLLHNDRT